MQNEDEQIGHLEESLATEREKQAAARKRAAEAERLKAEALTAAANRQLRKQASQAEAAAQQDAFEARKALEDAMELEMDMAESAVRPSVSSHPTAQPSPQRKSCTHIKSSAELPCQWS